MKTETTFSLRIQSDSNEKLFKDVEKFEGELGKALYKTLKRFFKSKINTYITGLNVAQLVDEKEQKQ